MARVVFLGTPEFGLPALEALAQAHEVLAVVTQPDRPAGRGRSALRPPPVKELALALGLEVLQPARLRRDREVVARLRSLGADVFVSAAYGQILRPEVLEIPLHGCIGVHASLLPRWRGAAPIAAAILHGDAETGVSLMLTDAGIDTGPVIAQRALAIAPRETTETLTARLARLGAELLIETLPAWLAGEITPAPQDDALATYAPMLDKAEGALNWRENAVALDRRIRAYTPWPGAYTHHQGLLLNVLSAHPLEGAGPAGEPGTVVALPKALGVVTGEGILVLDIVQPAGKRPMEGRAFAAGRRGLIGSRLDGED